MNLSKYYNMHQFRCAATMVVLLLLGSIVRAQTVIVTPLSNNNYSIGTDGLGTDDLVFYRFSDGYEMVAQNSGSNGNAAIVRQFKNPGVNVSAYVARKNGPVGIATGGVGNPQCNGCSVPSIGLVNNEYVRLRDPSWSPYTTPANPASLTDDKTTPDVLITPHIPWFIVPVTIRGPQPNAYVTVSIPPNMVVGGAIVKATWKQTPVGINVYGISDPDVSSFQYLTPGLFKINLTASYNNEFNVYLLVTSTTTIGTSSTFTAQAFNPNGFGAGAPSSITVLTRLNPHDPNHLSAFQDWFCGKTYDTPPLRYRVDFQNLGAGSAQTVKVKTLINKSIMDATTLASITSSHTLTSSTSTSDYVEFTFDNINLRGVNSIPQPQISLTTGWVEYSMNPQHCVAYPPNLYYYTDAFVTFISHNGAFSETIQTNQVKQAVLDICPDDPLCDATSNKQATGTETLESTLSAVKCYPTIFHDMLHLAIPALEESSLINITLSDITGKTWRNLSFNIEAGTGYAETIETQDLPAGMYLIHLMRGQHATTFKVIKN